jgi:hypothetical protein
MQWFLQPSGTRSASMTAETAPQPKRQMRAQGAYQRMTRYCMLAAVAHVLLRDRRFHATVITRTIWAVALASLVKNNEVRPVRRAIHWYSRLGASKTLARERPQARRELARAGQALEAGKPG